MLLTIIGLTSHLTMQRNPEKAQRPPGRKDTYIYNAGLLTLYFNRPSYSLFQHSGYIVHDLQGANSAHNKPKQSSDLKTFPRFFALSPPLPGRGLNNLLRFLCASRGRGLNNLPRFLCA